MVSPAGRPETAIFKGGDESQAKNLEDNHNRSPDDECGSDNCDVDLIIILDYL